MKRRLTIIALLIVASFNITAQIYDPVSWDFSYEKKSAKQFELIFIATVEAKSHIYSMDIPAGGPIPTTFQFDTIPSYTLDGKPFEVTKPEECVNCHFCEIICPELAIYSVEAPGSEPGDEQQTDDAGCICCPPEK